MTNEPLKIVGRIPRGPNKNGDVFLPEVLERAVEKMNEKAERGTLFGHIEAPYDGKTHLSHISHKVLPGVKLNEDGSVEAEIQVLDTEQGKLLQAMMEHSHKRMTFSVRGFGCPPDNLNITGIDVDIQFPRDWTVLDGICDALDNEGNQS